MNLVNFEQKVDEIEGIAESMEITALKDAINSACEEYIDKRGKKPDSFLLQRLGNLILRDDLKNADSYKIQKEDYPFHSGPQAKRRRKKEFTAIGDTLDFMNYKKKANLSTAPPKDNYVI